MLDYALSLNAPVAIRYPNGVCNAVESTKKFEKSGQWEVLKQGSKVALLAVGPRMIDIAKRVANQFSGDKVGVVNCRSVKPLDSELLKAFSCLTLITLEENSVAGGFGESVSGFFSDNQITAKTIKMGVPDKFIAHASVQRQIESCGLSEENIKKVVLSAIESVKK